MLMQLSSILKVSHLPIHNKHSKPQIIHTQMAFHHSSQSRGMASMSRCSIAQPSQIKTGHSEKQQCYMLDTLYWCIRILHDAADFKDAHIHATNLSAQNTLSNNVMTLGPNSPRWSTRHFIQAITNQYESRLSVFNNTSSNLREFQEIHHRLSSLNGIALLDKRIINHTSSFAQTGSRAPSFSSSMYYKHESKSGTMFLLAWTRCRHWKFQEYLPRLHETHTITTS